MALRASSVGHSGITMAFIVFVEDKRRSTQAVSILASETQVRVAVEISPQARRRPQPMSMASIA